MKVLFVALLAMSIPVPALGQSTARIGVRGDWSIDVLNPDGTPAGHYEFTNALFPSGEQTLAELLRGNRVAGRWQIILRSPRLETAVCRSPQWAICYLRESIDWHPIIQGVSFHNLVVDRNPPTTVVPTPVGTMSDLKLFTMAGSVVASGDQPVLEGVVSGVAFCNASDSPSQCRNAQNEAFAFSEHWLSPIPLVKGQIIQIKVQYSFAALAANSTNTAQQ